MATGGQAGVLCLATERPAGVPRSSRDNAPCLVGGYGRARPGTVTTCRPPLWSRRLCLVQAWDDPPVNGEYMVAANAVHRVVTPAPEGKCHAYLSGSDKTACGVGLNALQRFTELRFTLQPAAVRCPVCARAVGADH